MDRHRLPSVIVLMVAFASLTSGPVYAADAPAMMLERAIALYEEGEIAKAEPLLRGAAADLRDPKARARAFLYLGLVQASRKDVAATRDSLRAALSEDSLVAIDRERVAPDLVAMFDGLRAELTGEVWLDGAGAGASYSVDGRDSGAVATPLRLPIGQHSLRVISADGRGAYEAAGVLVQVRLAARVRVEFSARLGQVRISATWKGAKVASSLGREVLADAPARDLQAGAEPRQQAHPGSGGVRSAAVVGVASMGNKLLVTLPVGAQRLTLTLPGHLPIERDVVVPDGGVIDVSLPAPIAQGVTPWYRKRRVWGFVTLGAAGAVGLTGLLFGLSAKSAGDDIQQGRTNNTLRYDQYTSLRQTADGNALIANVLFGVAGAAAVAGAVLWATDRGDSSVARGWRLLPTLGGAAIAGRF